eukprot:TRINITY_DN67251_c16_g1_i1.p1 TRINITY_DN67251_c16_g1~~TRINITY_DN67251_c16_g1_i1.p1  ORF type:complete len:286 (+),score=24.46 TRINITY_DN67251_c16_g1_i1:58-915(+)
MAPCTCKERTNELHAIMASMSTTTQQRGCSVVRASKKLETARKFTEFAKYVTTEIATASDMLTKLSQLSRKRDPFHNYNTEINELSVALKQKTGGLHTDMQVLRQLRDAKHENKHSDGHRATVIKQLQQNLLETANQFHCVLQDRAFSEKAKTDRLSSFSCPTAIRTDFSHDYEQDQQNEQMQQIAPLIPQNQQYYQGRVNDTQQIQQGCHDVMVLMQQFEEILLRDEETILTIANEVEQSHENISAGRDILLRVLGRAASNRWLIMKVFALLFVFLLLFGVFLA